MQRCNIESLFSKDDTKLLLEKKIDISMDMIAFTSLSKMLQKALGAASIMSAISALVAKKTHDVEDIEPLMRKFSEWEESSRALWPGELTPVFDKFIAYTDMSKVGSPAFLVEAAKCKDHLWVPGV